MSAIEKYADHQDATLLQISTGEHFDYRSIHSFRNLCSDHLQTSVCVLVDMAETRYIDSSGVALLHCLQQWINAPQVQVRVINCSPQLQLLLSRSRLAHHITIDETVAAVR